ncbi:unnamed protein product [Phytophthora lilii]|uniref:Unnamed protein product n=1 Tax=Phytophthora lilii TaxID=2077276 RepID=A0A9W6TZ60_9STRA|nr:unnamed protein product [Phytophthora lilii]
MFVTASFPTESAFNEHLWSAPPDCLRVFGTRLHLIVGALALVASQATATPNANSTKDLNGWYPCYDYTFADEGPSPGKDAECAIYRAPFCYPGICETPEDVEPKVDIFVKRLLATSGNSATAANVWLLQGGPGYSSTAIQNGASTIVYGVSYGTMLVERLMHLAPPEVNGYVLDSIATSSGAPADEFMYTSNWDKDFGEAGDAFLALCDLDEECKTRFATRGLNSTLEDLINQFDKNPNSTCAALITKVKSNGLDGRPSSSLRFALGSLLKEPFMRTVIPPLVYRLHRCASKDINVLKKFVGTLTSLLSSKSEDDAYVSNVLYYLIAFSEMWEIPTPSKAEMKARYLGAKVSDDPMYPVDPVYCAFSKEKSAACEEFGLEANSANPLMYKRDEYWNKSATIPDGASVLLLSEKLDPQTHHKYAVSLLHALNGDKKELITFEYAPHGVVSQTQTVAGDPSSETCGRMLLVSYVINNGDLEKMNKSCVDAMPAFNLTIPPYYQNNLLSTSDAYDGEYDAKLSSQQSASS